MTMIQVNIEGRIRQIPQGTVLERLASEYACTKDAPIVLAMAGNKLQELHKTVKEPTSIRFITMRETPGIRAYERSLQLLMNKAVLDVAGKEHVTRVVTQFSVNGGLYMEAEGDFVLDQQWLDLVKDRMQQLVEANLPLKKSTMHLDDAIGYFSSVHMYEKEKLFRYRRSSNINVYELDGFIDYHYGYMVPSTGYLKYFDLKLYQDGFVLLHPDKKAPTQVAPFNPQDKLFAIMKESTRWSDAMNLSTVGDVNNMIAAGRIEDLILITEARQEKEIAEIASRIAADPKLKFILIAGPSSSGKTSFSHRLSIQLMAHGLTPHAIAVDDYFVDREKNPVDEFGNYDYEALECVDIPQFNADMNSLLEGKTVPMPTFNFIQGKREYKGNTLTMGANDILIIEGIHCLNDKMSQFMPADSKFKIYISALTQLNIDEHNRIPTTDGRLIRRMIRDARTRGASAVDTIARWASVRKGEEKNIFPYQETADVMFNSSLIYEFSVMKSYAEQLLFGIPKDAPEYMEAKRLLKFFDYFLAVDSTRVPYNSLLKEFIGGSVFRV